MWVPSVWLVACLGFLAVNLANSLYFDVSSSSDSSDSSNSTESDEWTGPLLSILLPVLGVPSKATTTPRPTVKPANTPMPANATVIPSNATVSPPAPSRPQQPTIIKCSSKPTDSCPSNCMTDSAIIHGFCCNCKPPLDVPVKPGYLCPVSTICPGNTTKLCDMFSRLMVCCCQNDFMPKPSTLPPPAISQPTPPTPPPMGLLTPPTPPTNSGPQPPTPPASGPQSATPPTSNPQPPAPTNGPQSPTPPVNSSQAVPTNPTPPTPSPPGTANPPPTSNPTLPSDNIAVYDSPPDNNGNPSKHEIYPTIIRPQDSNQQNIDVDIDSIPEEEEVVDLPLNIKRTLRKI